MGVLKTLKEICLKGKLIPPGTKIQVDDEDELIGKGYARRLTKDESRAIIDEYVAYAEKVFSEKPTVSVPKKDTKPVKKTYEMRGLFEND